ncbi:hypothetical protein [Halomonas caseinilytica]|nr:hypothetical protein [Halomonas caseinilytica]SEN70966.1 hypothetical protein SAMN04487952_1261 [Halomonas caseinilytica]
MAEKGDHVTMPNLSAEESQHVSGGGRVFIVEEIEGPDWRVLMVKGNTCTIMLEPNDSDGYGDEQYTYDLALAVANLSEDSPLVRPI